MTLSAMMEQDAATLCGPRHRRDTGAVGHRWGRTRGPIGFHGGKVVVERPRVRAKGSKVELARRPGRRPLPRTGWGNGR